MAGYLDAADVQLTIGSTSTTRLPDYERAIAAATSQIDRWTGRRFLRDDEPVTRMYRADSRDRLCVGDFTDPDDVIVETDDLGNGTWSTWDATEWRAEADDRVNGSFVRSDGEPWRWISTTGTRKFPVYRSCYWPGYFDYDYGWPGSDWRYGEARFPRNPGLTGPARVRVTTRWGWESPPSPVLQACLILSIAYFQSKDRSVQMVDGDPMKVAKGLLIDYAVDGGTLCNVPQVG